MPSSSLRSPRAEVLVAGKAAPALRQLEISLTSTANPSTARVEFALRGTPWQDWVAAGQLPVTIRLGFGSALQTMYTGEVDVIDTDFLRGTLTMSTRDLSAAMTETKFSEKLLNLRSHRLAERLGKKYGLEVVAPQSRVLVGAALGNDSSQIKASTTEWDTLTLLAQQEGRRLFIDNGTLYFLPEADFKAYAYAISWSGRPASPHTPHAPISGLRFTHTLSLSGRVEVKVTSWNVESGDEVTATARRQAGPSGIARDRVATYERTIPNLTQDAADKRAVSGLAEITQQEVQLDFEAPADNELGLQSVVLVSGTGSPYDKKYRPLEIKRTFSLEQGYQMQVRATTKTEEASSWLEAS